jgi:hypothetical protein
MRSSCAWLLFSLTWRRLPDAAFRAFANTRSPAAVDRNAFPTLFVLASVGSLVFAASGAIGRARYRLVEHH